MKKILSLLAVFTILLGAVSCQKEVHPGEKGDSKVTFSVVIPDELATRAGISNGSMIDQLRYEVYVHGTNDKPYYGIKSYEAGTSRFELELALVSELTYDIIFWAGSSKADCYTFHSLKNVEVSYNNAKANDEKRDAFCGAIEGYKATPNIATSQEVYLRRPFAQVNFGSSRADWERAQPFVSTSDNKSGLLSKVVFSKLANRYNALTGEASGTSDNVIFEYTQAPVLSSDFKNWNNTFINYQQQAYARIAMNYVLPISDPATVSKVTGYFKHNLITDDAQALYKEVLNVPVKQNHRTNILGEIFTGGNKFVVIIESKFVNEENPDLYPEYNVVSPLEFAIENGGTFTLEQDAVISTSYTITKDVVINLNGHKLTYNGEDIFARLQNSGSLTFTGNGTFESSSYIASANAGGKVVVENGTFKTTDATLFQSNGGTVVIKGGSFQSEPYEGTYFTLNKVDNVASAKIEVMGGTFYKYNPAESNTEPGGPVSFLKSSEFTVSQDGDWYTVSYNN